MVVLLACQEAVLGWLGPGYHAVHTGLHMLCMWVRCLHAWVRGSCWRTCRSCVLSAATCFSRAAVGAAVAGPAAVAAAAAVGASGIGRTRPPAPPPAAAAANCGEGAGGGGAAAGGLAGRSACTPTDTHTGLVGGATVPPLLLRRRGPSSAAATRCAAGRSGVTGALAAGTAAVGPMGELVE